MTTIDGYVLALRYINPRNKSGIIRLVADMLKEHKDVDIDKLIDKLYPPRGRRR